MIVKIDNRLWVRKTDLPPGHEQAIKQLLTIRNGDKEKAAKLNQWRWQDLPDSFELYEEDHRHLILPRGFASLLRAGVEATGEKVIWDDQTAATPVPPKKLLFEGPTLALDQEDAAQAILQHRQGVLMAPTGAGKTVTILETWRRTCLTGLILVEKAQLAGQWRERAREHLGIEPGLIGEGEWDERPLTIAMMQTLRRREIGDNWWMRWGFCAADECHHLRAETYNALIRQVRSRFLVGVTATPLEGMWEQPFLTNTLGPIFHITSDEQLRETGRRVVPMIKRVYTGWKWSPQSRREAALVDNKAIYRHILKALNRDQRRVQAIVRKIQEQPSSCSQLVLCRSLAYLDMIRDSLVSHEYDGEIYMLRGAERGQKAQQITEAAADGNCVILSTVAGEGTDIPRLDRLHLVWPMKQELGLTQAVGRILRAHPDKKDAIVFDYVDDEGMLFNQARLRAMFYRKSGYNVEEERIHA